VYLGRVVLCPGISRRGTGDGSSCSCSCTCTRLQRTHRIHQSGGATTGSKIFLEKSFARSRSRVVGHVRPLGLCGVGATGCRAFKTLGAQGVPSLRGTLRTAGAAAGAGVTWYGVYRWWYALMAATARPAKASACTRGKMKPPTGATHKGQWGYVYTQ